MALHSCPSAMLYHRAVITRVVITGIYYIHTLHTHDDDSEMGAEGAGGSTQVVVGLGSRQPPDGYLVAGRPNSFHSCMTINSMQHRHVVFLVCGLMQT